MKPKVYQMLQKKLKKKKTVNQMSSNYQAKRQKKRQIFMPKGEVLALNLISWLASKDCKIMKAKLLLLENVSWYDKLNPKKKIKFFFFSPQLMFTFI